LLFRTSWPSSPLGTPPAAARA